MERLSLVLPITSFLDLKSIYAFFRLNRSQFRLWSSDFVWNSILYRENPQERLTVSREICFSILDCRELKRYLHTKVSVKSAKSFLQSFLLAFETPIVLSLRPLSESTSSPDQHIGNTVSPAESLRWVSAGSAVNSSVEFLSFTIPLSFLFWVGIRLYRDYVGSGFLYAPQQIQLKIGLEIDKWTYESEKMCVEVTESMQYFVLLPRIIAGRFVRVEFIGKREKSPLDGEFYVAVEKVTCAGIPAKFDGNWLEIEKKEEEIREENYGKWTEQYLNTPWLIQYHHLLAIEAIGRLPAFLSSRTLHPRFKRLTKLESCFFASHLPACSLPPSLQCLFTPSEQLGDIYFTRGELTKAYRVYTSRGIVRKIAMCLLALQAFGQCLTLLDTTEFFDMPTVGELERMAGDLAVGNSFQQYLTEKWRSN